jgi:surface antigen
MGWPRLWRSLPALLMAGVLAIGAGGCSFSYQLDSLFSKSDSGSTAAVKPHANARADDDLTTGAIKPMVLGARSPRLPPEQDLAYARAAASVVLSREGKSASQPWENPQTGARGTVTAIALAYTQNGFTCRDFLASYVKGQAESWMQGEACRVHHGKWMVRSLKPWNRT